MTERRAYTPRRGLRRVEAAAYVGLSPSKFDELVQDGRIPPPFAIDGCRVWDIHELDEAFDALKLPARIKEPEFDRL